MIIFKYSFVICLSVIWLLVSQLLCFIHERYLSVVMIRSVFRILVGFWFVNHYFIIPTFGIQIVWFFFQACDRRQLYPCILFFHRCWKINMYDIYTSTRLYSLFNISRWKLSQYLLLKIKVKATLWII